jgi:hypothetical protein
MGSAPESKKKPSLVSKPSDPQPESNTPERVRKPHYDWEHESVADAERPRVKTSAARISQWKENVEAWIRRYLTLADSSFGDRDDDPTPA